MKRLTIPILRLFLVSGLLFSLSTPVYGADDGGAVQTNGVIEFYDETATSSSEPTTSSSPATSEEPLTTSKPQGKYPSTGELVKASLKISGAIIVILVLVFFLWKRKKEQEEQDT